ncbi:MAG: polysaccharide biosynthesis protein [Acidobacteriota bacterium]
MPLKTASKFLTRLRNRHFIAIDTYIMFLTPLLALFFRLDGRVDWAHYGSGLFYCLIIFTPIKLSVFYLSGMYRRYWRLASIDEMAYLIFAGINMTLVQVFVFGILRIFPTLPFVTLPYTFAILDAALTMIFVSTIRFSIRFVERAKERAGIQDNTSSVLIVGAGQAGTAIALEMQRNPQLGMRPVGFVDDDPQKQNARIRGLSVLGRCEEIPLVLTKTQVSKVIIAMPTAPGTKLRSVVNMCSNAGIETLTIPGIFEILDGKISVSKIRKIEIADLLRRDPIVTDVAKVGEFLKDKRVLVTGAGGSIGSELCRQILKFNPSELILLGHGENSIFEIEQELRSVVKATKSKTVLSPVIADIKSRQRLRFAFKMFKPEVIFHAAAHKHVPLMESNPNEAVTNNIMGSKNLIDTAVEFNVKNFVLISTDKAVNPTSIMGASKRIAEMLLINAARRTGNCYSAVRFGNVLGSRGSVVQTFKKQLAAGGPITVTHEDIIRYFMTIPEAVQLVLQASILGNGGDIFVFDMGNPVKIYDMARDFIRLSGLKEGLDINIEVTGLRPGEKLYEELFVEGEDYKYTLHDKIMLANNSSKFIPENLEKTVEYLINSNCNSRADVVEKLAELIPEIRHELILQKAEG